MARKNDPLKIKARSMIASAIASGKLIRPDTCEYCGSIPVRAKDGRSNIEAHHEDHAKPYEVQWLCTACHGKLTVRAEGEENYAAKLNPSAVRVIRTFYTVGIKTRDIGRWFGVTSRVISLIGRRKLWAHVDPEWICLIPVGRVGSGNSVAKLTEQDIPIIREAVFAGESIREIACRFSVSVTTIYHIKRGLKWSHVL